MTRLKKGFQTLANTMYILLPLNVSSIPLLHTQYKTWLGIYRSQSHSQNERQVKKKSQMLIASIHYSPKNEERLRSFSDPSSAYPCRRSKNVDPTSFGFLGTLSAREDIRKDHLSGASRRFESRYALQFIGSTYSWRLILCLMSITAESILFPVRRPALPDPTPAAFSMSLK